MTQLRFVLIIAGLALAFGYVGESDYQEAARNSCEAKGFHWNGENCMNLKTGRKVQV